MPAVSGNHTPDHLNDDPGAALERLDAALDRRDFTITLAPAGNGCPPMLTVASRHCPLTENILADQRFYWYAWGEPICPVSDPAAAATKIAQVLRAVPEPSHG